MSYLPSARAQFAYYKQLGDQTLARLTVEQLRWRPGEESNSIATIVKHLHGNMLSRWTDFLTSDGEKDSRDREGEFTPDDVGRAEVLARWEAGWRALFTALDDVESAGGDADAHLVYIRNMGHTVTEAINRQLCHYAYHVGQITFVGRMLVGREWESLSIPRGGSAEYNAAAFAKGRRREHFTEEWLDAPTEKAPPRLAPKQGSL